MRCISSRDIASIYIYLYPELSWQTCIAIYHTAILFIATLGGFANAQISVSAFYPAFKTISPTFKAVFRFQHCLVLQSLFWTNWSTPTDFFGEATLLLSRISSIIFVLSLLSWLNVYFLHRSNFKWQTHESLDRKTTNATFPPNFTENHSRLTILAHKESKKRIGKSFPHLSSPSISIFI